MADRGGKVGEYSDGRAAWQCCRCGLVQPWGEDWYWHGSWRQAEDGTLREVYCGPTCPGRPPVKGRPILRLVKGDGR